MPRVSLPGLLAILVTLAGAVRLPAEESLADLEGLIERDRARAIVVGLYRDGETTLHGLGRRTAANAERPSGDTRFEIGSISKVFTALLTQIMVGSGRLDWDATIARCLPELEFASPQVADITLRELATHRSGLPRLPDNMEMSDPLDPYADYERDDLLAFLGAYAPDQLDKTYAYSNLGAGLLGQIAADAAGASYGDAVRGRIAAPLGMRATGVGVHGESAESLAVGFSDGADMPNWGGFDALAGAGALVSTAHDLLRFIEANLQGEALAEELAAIRAPQTGGQTGLGWHILRLDDGARIYWHNGGTGGYASFLGIRSDTRTGVVVLTTSTAYDAVTEAGFRLIGAEPEAQPVADLDRYVGAYRLGEGFVLSVFAEDGRLFGQASGQAAFPLSPAEEHVLVYPPADIRIVFVVDETGAAEALTLHQAGSEIPGPRVADEAGIARYEEIYIDPSRLEAYLGRYLLAPGMVLTVERRGPTLFAAITGQTAFPVFPYAEDRFFYRVVDAQLAFERDESGQVVAVTLNQAGQRRAPRIE